MDPPPKRQKIAHEDPRVELLLSWLSKHNTANLHTIDVRQSPTTLGLGLFTKVAVKPGHNIVTIPQECVLSALKALRSEVGVACRQVHPSCSAEFVLLL